MEEPQIVVNGDNNKLDIWAKPAEIRKLFCRELSDAEWKYFFGLAMSLGANPFKREIFAVKYGQAPAQVFLGRDFYRRKAEEQPNYDGHLADAVYENDQFSVENGIPKHSYTLKNRGKLMGAYGIVWKTSTTHPYYVFCRFDEYVQIKKDGEPMALWKDKPQTMITKVAESQILRGAFQGAFEGTYSFSERWETHKAAQIGEAVDTPEGLDSAAPPEDEKLPPETRNEAKERLKNEIADLRQQLGGPAHFNNFMKKYFEGQDINSMAEIELAKVLIQMQKSVDKLREKAEAGPRSTADEAPEAESQNEESELGEPEEKNRPQFVAYAIAELNKQKSTHGILSIVDKYPQFKDDARFQKALQQVEANIRATSQTAQEQL